jgi:hypothetical protein
MSLVASSTSKSEAIGCGFGEDLQAELPFGKSPDFDGVPQVAAVEVRVGAVDLDRFVPDQRMGAEPGGVQWNLTKCRRRLGVDQPEGVHAEALHHAKGCAGWPRSDMTHISM